MAMIARLNLGNIHLQFFPAVSLEDQQTVPCVVSKVGGCTGHHDLQADQLDQLIADLNRLRLHIKTEREGV